jgi:hypothetical protein
MVSLSWLFVMASPFLVGGLLPLVMVEWFHSSGNTAIITFYFYVVAWFYIWIGLLDGGRKLKIM